MLDRHPSRRRSCRASTPLAAGLVRALLGGIAIVGVLACASAATAATLEETKADMVWNLTKFVHWPDALMKQNQGRIVLTILGEDEFAATLANQLSTRTVNGKPIFIRFAQRVQDVKGSHVVYIAAPEMVHVEAILSGLEGMPVLTVADAPGFAGRGGMVDFATLEGRLRFEIHVGHAEASGLRISSRVLALARVLEDER